MFGSVVAFLFGRLLILAIFAVMFPAAAVIVLLFIAGDAWEALHQPERAA